MDPAARRLSPRHGPVPNRRAAALAAAVAAALAFTIVATLAPTPAVRVAAAALAAVANPDTLTMSHDRVAIVPAPGVLKNDTNLLGGTTAVFVSGTTHGSVSLAADGGYTYVPNAGFVGTDVFRYRDSGLLTNTTTVTITVGNAAPVAVDDAYAATTGVTLTVPAPGVLANDTDGDGDTLTATLVDGSGNGSVSLSSNGRLVFTSGVTFSGARTITYRITDGLAWSAIATITIDVRPSSPSPTPTPVPTATPPPVPTPTPVPSFLPTALPTVPPILPSALPSIRPIPTPTPRPTPDPGASGSPEPSAAPPSGSSVPPIGGGSTSGGGGDPGSGDPNGAGPGAAGGTGGSTGGRRRTTDGTFSVGRDDPVDVAGLSDLRVMGWNAVIDWAVPAATLTVPGLLLILAVLAQMFGGLVWLPVARRWLGGFGLRRRRSRTPGAA